MPFLVPSEAVMSRSSRRIPLEKRRSPIVKFMAGKGCSAQGDAASREKVKFTVSVRGHQWSSARHLQETLEEFAKVIQRNARRLDFIGENDKIQRLHLAKADGSEPEELDVDATMEDVIICMGSKHLVAIVIPATPPSHQAYHCGGSRRREAEKLGPPSPTCQFGPKDYSQTDFLPTPTTVENGAAVGGHLGLKPIFLRRRPASGPPTRGMKIIIPPTSDPNSAPAAAHHEERGGSAPENFPSDNRTAQPRPNSNGLLHSDGPGMVTVSKNGGPMTVTSSKATPSPAELAHFLIKGSSLAPNPAPPPPRPNSINVGENGSHHHSSSTFSQYFGSCSASVAGYHTFASGILSRLPVLPPGNIVCGPSPDSVAVLAQFLASQLRAFAPPEGETGVPASASDHPSPASSSGDLSPPPKIEHIATPARQEAVPSSGCKPFELHGRASPIDGPGPRIPRPLDGEDPARASRNAESVDLVGGLQDKDRTAQAAANGGSKSESVNSRSELIFFVNRRSKTGIGAHHLKLSDLSVFFHLSVVDAAKKLGVSQTTLKKACRKFGLKRWPGRKVRSLESTIHGLEHTIAVGQGAGMEQLTEAYMRSEVTKLQREMDQLVHGTLAQHSPVARTADLYKRLYSRGWRSKYHSPSFDLDLNVDSRDSELTLAFNARPKPSTNGCKPESKQTATLWKPDIATDLSDCNRGHECRAGREVGMDGETRSSDSAATEDEMGRRLIRKALTAPDQNGVEKSIKTVENNAAAAVVDTDRDEELPTEKNPKRPKLDAMNVTRLTVI